MNGIWLLIGVFIGIAGPFFAKRIDEIYLKPKPRIGNDSPYKSKNFTFHSIEVKNKGRTVAKNCNALLTIKNLEKNDIIDSGNTFLNSSNFRPVLDEPLCWSFASPGLNGQQIDPPYISIYPESKQLFELCVVDNRTLEVTFSSEAAYNTARVVINGNKEYDLEVKVIAENVRYDKNEHRKTFKMKPNATNNDIELKPILLRD